MSIERKAIAQMISNRIFTGLQKTGSFCMALTMHPIYLTLFSEVDILLQPYKKEG